VARQTKHSRALEQALNDAAQSGLEIHQAKLIQERIRALSKLVEREHDATVERLTNELSRVTEDNRRMTAITQPKKPTQLREIEELLARHKSKSEEVV
jgi:hypothetical protein